MATVSHTLGVVHEVADLAGAAEFLERALELPICRRGADWVEADNGSVCLRLVSARDAAGLLTLDVRTKDVEGKAAELETHAGVRALSGPDWVTPERFEIRLKGPHGFQVCVMRVYDEDELGMTPPLPAKLPWDADATDRVQQLLRRVPVVFRDTARTKVTTRAEFLSVESGDLAVSLFHGVQAVAQTTPSFQLDRLRQAFEELGLDPAHWQADFKR